MEYVTEAEQSSMHYVTEAEQYQVFINHRGPDTKKNLASLIYHNLSSYGLRVFLDKEELRTGNTLCPAIRGAISSASVHIAIFSQNYAESQWCLDELCWMLKSSSVIPVFYDVEPADLRRIDRGPYAQAFDKHRQRVSREVVEGWKEALRKAADISGLLFKTKDSDYSEFVEEIGKIVRERVRWDPLDVATHPVGLDQTLKELDDLIQKQSSTRVVVIAGIGGIGKSTLAKEIFNSRRSNFSRASYLSNFRDKVDLTSFQRQLLRELLGLEKEITNSHTGKTILRNGLKGLKVLIILDDVDDRKKIKSVLDMNAVGDGSLIFITSRDKDILRGSSADTLLYDVRPLKRNHARVLFCHHAFHQSNPLEGYEDLVEEFLKICGGLPLCLKVLGEQLSGKLDGSYWKRQLEIFSHGLPLTEADTVINTLKWSYTAMEIDQQEMLLDVGCFFVGEDLELAVRVLEGLGYLSDARNCLESLRPKCLVDFNNDVETQDEIGKQGQDISISEGRHLILPTVLAQRSSKIIMQNQVRELARRIAREALRTMDKPLRLSCSIDIEKMLQLQSGSVLCRGICIRNDWTLPQLPNHIHIRGVRLLVVEHPIDSSWFLGSGISGDLVWLRWRNCRFISLPRTISLRNLRVLELQYPKEDIEKFFDSIYEIPSQLRELSIDAREEDASSSTSSSTQPVHLPHLMNTSFNHLLMSIESSMKELRKIVLREEGASSSTSSSAQTVDHSKTLQDVMPSFFGFLQSIGTLMKNFDKIVLKNVTVPQSLPFDCSELKNLRHLDLSGSTNLTTLPKSFSQLLQLQHLALRDCINLSIPTDILGEISTLEHIDLKGCAQLVHLPQGISSQRRLRYLNLLQTSLLDLPFHLEPVDKLEQLSIGSATLTELPNSVAHFVNLKELILVKCVNLSHISTPIEQLARLERLEIYGSKLPILPAGIAQLKHLRVLTIFSSPIEEFAFDNNVMYALTDFTLINTSVCNISIPSGACPRLEIVDLSYNRQLRRVRVFQSTLVKLNLDDCLNLVDLKVSKLVHLKFLNINGCVCVEILDVENWRSLEEIRAERCWNLRMREDAWSQLERLKFFSFSQKFRWDEVQEKVGSMEKDEYEMVISQVREKAGSMEKAKYEMMFQLFMSMTIRMLRPVEEHELEFELEKLNEEVPYLMCFLTSDEGEFTKCNDFMVRFVYTTIKSYETRANETRANETGWFAITSLQSCQEIMAYGTGTPKGVYLFENEESLERVGDDDSGELHHVQQTLEGNTMGVSLMLEDEMSSHLKQEMLEAQVTQVFITYSVPDIKNTLASLVYYRLANCYGLRVFMDDEENRTEDSPSPAILTAISSASVHIVFFSENYAESLRFLDELCWVLGSSHPCTLIPVFCDVEPDDLRPIDGAFRTHEPKGQVAIEVLERWKEVLEKAAATPGHLFKTKESDSGEFLEKIEKNVLEELRWEPLQVAPDVFINHRGPEIKMTLASLIYNRLKICGFRGFHDKKETADTVSPAILSAIRSASLHITIFSKGYAESRRCLDELFSILRSCDENDSLIIPVFCGVKPDDLFNIDGGCYAQAFNQHQREGGVSMEVADGWKMALRKASKISGLLFQTNESDYGEFLQIFVEIVLNKVKWEAVGVAREVFINHNGPDVNVSLASLIDNRLKICGLRIFQDNNEIHTGDALSTSILSAIRTASLHVVIFSQCYAESRQCLDELTWIFRSSPGSKIIPVFCDVEPIDLRGIGSGRYALAFQKHLHSGKVAREVLDTWKTALRQASDISGLFFKMNESEEGEFVERIVEIVLDGVKREPLEVATHPVGLDQAAEDFQNEILNQNNSIPSKIVGIAGIGGVGKTTLVKYIFNLRRSDFSRSCYLSNIREKMDLLCLQRQLLRDLLGIDEYIINTIEGKRILRDHLQGLQILLVLDGVDHIEQIDSLVDMDALGAGSLILLTSRDKDVLGKSSPTTLLYDVKPLNRRHAKELFCRHAFLQFKPLEGYEYLVQKFLEICGGLPLSLEVIGGLLADNLDKTYWMLQLKKFSKRLPDEILDTLKVSYQSLNKKEKEMYLDIGCFLAGEEIELAVRVLQGSGYTNVRETLESLRIKCLLDFHSEVESNNDINYKYKHPDIFRLIMHNQIRGLARHIAREEFIEFSEHKPFRLSCSNDMNQMLQLQDGSDFSWIRGIRIPKAQDPPQLMNHINIRGVRFLVVEHPIDLSSFRMSGDLVWLRLNNFPSVSIPSTISLANLRVLELHSLGDHNEQLFEGSDELSSESSESNASARGCASASASSSRQPFDVEHDTKFSRNISNTLQHVMPSFSRFLQWTGTFMNKIVLKNMDTLESIPIDFSELKNLRHLDLSGCIHLTKLSNSFSQLKRLQYLALRDCKNLSMPTDILGEISTLEYVDFKGCAQLVHLPTGMARQRSLRYLDLLCTPKLQLSMNLELLGQLEQLRIGSPLLTELPHSVNLLMSLQVLVLIECRGLKSILPREIAGPNIKVLVIQGSPITNFSFEDQGMMHCVMGVLRDFSLRNTSISEICIPGGLYPSLKTVDLSDNIWLTQVKGLSSTLTRLNLQGCRILERLTNLSNLVNLKFLNINRCLGLETLNIEGLISLEEIKAEGCWNLKRIRGLSQRERLNRLQISTSNSVIWNDICKFLTLRPSYGKLSTASFSGMVDVKRVLDNREMRRIMEQFNVKMVDIVSASTTSEFHVKLENLHSQDAILMCFITSGVSPGLFRVRFEASNDGGPTQEYRSLRGSGDGKRLHVFMWTEDSHLFRDYKNYSNIDVYCSRVDVSEFDAEHVERGWMVMVDKDTDFSRVCKEFIVAFT